MELIGEISLILTDFFILFLFEERTSEAEANGTEASDPLFFEAFNDFSNSRPGCFRAMILHPAFSVEFGLPACQTSHPKSLM